MDSYEGERDDQEEKCKRNGKRPESGRARERASERESVAVAMVENKNAFALCTRERSVFWHCASGGGGAASGGRWHLFPPSPFSICRVFFVAKKIFGASKTVCWLCFEKLFCCQKVAAIAYLHTCFRFSAVDKSCCACRCPCCRCLCRRLCYFFRRSLQFSADRSSVNFACLRPLCSFRFCRYVFLLMCCRCLISQSLIKAFHTAWSKYLRELDQSISRSLIKVSRRAWSKHFIGLDQNISESLIRRLKNSTRENKKNAGRRSVAPVPW